MTLIRMDSGKDVRVVVSRVIQVVADAGCDQDPQILSGYDVPQLAQVDHPVHHLGDAETVAKVVEWVVSVVLLDAKL